ncbi:hypothetical protein [Actinomycetospora atypica]|uniref:Uncharacterized protein n=1 Tax=Actinomycetospora atypica TaxID=1290095 RepID=A0ABV9YFZ0_9PSEU
MLLDFGDVPGWIEAIATSLAFAGTTSLLWIESRRRREERRAQTESQASKVAHWLDKSEAGEWSLKYRNASDVPVYRIRVHAYLNGVDMGYRQMRRIYPTGEEHTRRRINEWLNDIVLANYDEKVPIWIDLVFADATGRGWVRDLDGSLVQLKGTASKPPERFSGYEAPEREDVGTAIEPG